jgi:hypothetical protein
MAGLAQRLNVLVTVGTAIALRNDVIALSCFDHEASLAALATERLLS